MKGGAKLIDILLALSFFHRGPEETNNFVCPLELLFLGALYCFSR